MAAKSPLPPSVGEEATLLGDRAPLTGSDVYWRWMGEGRGRTVSRSHPCIYLNHQEGARGGAGQTVVTSSAKTDKYTKMCLQPRKSFCLRDPHPHHHHPPPHPHHHQRRGQEVARPRRGRAEGEASADTSQSRLRG